MCIEMSLCLYNVVLGSLMCLESPFSGEMHIRCFFNTLRSHFITFFHVPI